MDTHILDMLLGAQLLLNPSDGLKILIEIIISFPKEAC